eukprot:EG_transcript_30147
MSQVLCDKRFGTRCRYKTITRSPAKRLGGPCRGWGWVGSALGLPLLLPRGGDHFWPTPPLLPHVLDRGPLHPLRGPLHRLRGPLHHLRVPLHRLRVPLHRLRVPQHRLRVPQHRLRVRVHRLRGPLHHLRGPLHRLRGP